MTKKKVPVLSIVLYVIAGLLLLYTVWALSKSISYINEMVAMGQLVVKGSEYDIVNFYMSNCSQYAVYAVILFTLGWVLQYLTGMKQHVTLSENGEVGVVSASEDENDSETDSIDID
jgi:hypothetical protein